jgi:2-phospho-L-lactate guanylyltransferase
MRTAAILPVKRFEIAKRRLRASVPEPLHGELAQAMLTDVLTALSGCAAIEQTIVVTASPDAAKAARAHGAHVVGDPAEDGQSLAVGFGIKHASKQGFGRVLCLPGDCPALDPADVADLLGGGEPDDGVLRREVVIVPDRHETGTNALVLRPPDTLAPSFGPDSFERHRRLAGEAGIPCVVKRPPSLLLDIDTGDDLLALLGLPHADSATAAVLAKTPWPS